MKFNYLFLVYSSLVLCVLGDRTKESIYYDITGVNVCIRRFNLTHQIGCSSSRSGDVGVLHYVSNDVEWEWFLNKGPHKPYILMLTADYFNVSIIEQAKDKITGVLFLRPNSTDVPVGFSSDSTCPNPEFELYNEEPEYKGCKQVQWNPSGNAMFFNDYGFPIAILSNWTEIEFLKEQCYETFNRPHEDNPRDYPLCAIQMKSAMDGAVDTPTCMRRSNKITSLNPQGYCDPLAGKSIYSFVHPLNDTTSGVTAAITRLDSFTVFDQVYPGTEADVTGIITLLAAADALAQLRDELVNAKPILFYFFSGEAFDYSGSTRFMYELQKGRFHGLTIDSFESIIEVLQVGKLDAGSLWLHADPVSLRDATIKAQVEELVRFTKTQGAGFNLTFNQAEDIPLPPASTQTLLKEKKLPNMMITDHKEAYSNNYYHSIYDNYTSLDLPETMEENATTPLTEQLTNLASTLANLLYYKAKGTEAVNLQADGKLVSSLVYCFLYNVSCRLFNETINEDAEKEFAKLNLGSMTFYVTPSTESNTVSHFTRLVLAYRQGQADVPSYCTGDSSKKCCEKANQDKGSYRYYWMHGSNFTGVCIKSTANSTSAMSPAFIEEGYDFYSNKYPAWTESRWALGAIFIRAFLVPPRWLEAVELTVGLILMVASLLIFFFVGRRSHILFPQGQRRILELSIRPVHPTPT